MSALSPLLRVRFGKLSNRQFVIAGIEEEEDRKYLPRHLQAWCAGVRDKPAGQREAVVATAAQVHEESQAEPA